MNVCSRYVITRLINTDVINEHARRQERTQLENHNIYSATGEQRRSSLVRVRTFGHVTSHFNMLTGCKGDCRPSLVMRRRRRRG